MVSAIRHIETDRPDLFAFEVRDRIGMPDIEAMAETMERAFERHDTVDMIVIVSHWDGVETDAVFDRKALAAQAASVRHVRRYAVVGAPGWAETMINLMSPLSPVDAKTFDADDETEAWSWVGGKPVGMPT